MNTRKAALTVLSIALKIVIMAVIVLGIFKLGSTAFSYGHSVFQEEALDPMPGRTITVTVEDGSSAKTIAKLMEHKGEELEAFLYSGHMLQVFQDYESRNLYPFDSHEAQTADGSHVGRRGGFRLGTRGRIVSDSRRENDSLYQFP